MKKRVVITGMGVTSSIGSGIDNFWRAAVEGCSGIQRIKSYDPGPFPTQIAGEIHDLAFEELPGFDKPKRYPLAAQYALYCAYHAIQQSGLTPSELKTAGTYIGTSLGGGPELEKGYDLFYSGKWRKIPALTVLRAMPNAIANHIAIEFGIGGPNATVSNACVSAAEALGHAYHQISHGGISVALCGGTESLIWETVMSAWCKLRVMSTKNETPEKACSPFDQNRDGLVMADGAGILVLEDYEHARARGAKMYAEIAGFGSSCDAKHITAPSSEGQVRAINSALNDARMSPNDIHHINAHGTGTRLNDFTETETIKQVFGEKAYQIPITAQKSMTGHSIGAAGALDIITTTLCIQNNILLPTINLHNQDPECDLDYIPNVARKACVDIALSNHFAFGGANAAIIVKRV